MVNSEFLSPSDVLSAVLHPPEEGELIVVRAEFAQAVTMVTSFENAVAELFEALNQAGDPVCAFGGKGGTVTYMENERHKRQNTKPQYVYGTLAVHEENATADYIWPLRNPKQALLAHVQYFTAERRTQKDKTLVELKRKVTLPIKEGLNPYHQEPVITDAEFVKLTDRNLMNAAMRSRSLNGYKY